MDRGDVLTEIMDSGIRGRGGAGFQMGKKVSFLPHGGMEKYLVCNADESEPGTFKDRELMQKSPHMLIEGIVIAAYAGEIDRAFIYIRGEYQLQADILEAAIAEAQAAGYLGENILGSGIDLPLVLHRGAGAYICGEETGLLDSLEGKRGNPRLKPPFPAIEGLYHGPTLINNVETLATVPHIIGWAQPSTPRSAPRPPPGPSSCRFPVTSSGPGNYEIELGIPSREIIYGLAGGPPSGKEIKFWFPGGSSSPVLTKDDLDVPYDFDSLAKAGTMLGSGAIIVADESRRVLDTALKLAKFYAHESCGKCVPCREGTNWTHKMLAADLHRRGDAHGPRHHGLGPGADHRQLPVRAGRRHGHADRLDGGEVPRRARGRDRGRPRARRPRRRRGRRRPRRRRRARRSRARPLTFI